MLTQITIAASIKCTYKPQSHPIFCPRHTSTSQKRKRIKNKEKKNPSIIGRTKFVSKKRKKKRKTVFRNLETDFPFTPTKTSSPSVIPPKQPRGRGVYSSILSPSLLTMLLPSPLLRLPTTPLKSPHPAPFLHGSSSSFPSSTIPFPKTTQSSPPSTSTPPPVLTVRAMKKIQGRVVCATNDKTVAVEVVRLAPHPKYKRRVRIKKKYQAHDPDNRFQVGDFVQLEKSRPISKTKTFLAVPVAARNAPNPVEAVPDDLRGLPPLQSAQEQQETQ